MKRVSVQDLTLAQVIDIETDPKVGKPMSDWGDAPSEAYLLASIFAAGNAVPVDDVLSKTLRDLQEMVSLGEDDADPQKPT